MGSLHLTAEILTARTWRHWVRRRSTMSTHPPQNLPILILGLRRWSVAERRSRRDFITTWRLTERLIRRPRPRVLGWPRELALRMRRRRERRPITIRASIWTIRS